MLKCLAILAVCLALTVNPGKKDKSPNLPQNDSQNQKAPAVSFVSNQTCSPNTESAKAETPHWYTSPEWWLCILGIPTLVFLFWQAKATADAARGAQASAESGMAQIQLMREQSHRMVEKERARLKLRCDGADVQWGPTGTWTLFADIWIANHGSSNAYITRKWGKLLVAPLGGTTPELDDSCDILLPYPFDIIKPEAEPIRVNLALDHAPSSFRDLCIGITSSRITMYLYGFIEYETMGEGWHLPFKYRWEMSSIPDGISERDLASDINIVGGWDNPGQQESGEYRINPN